MSSNKILVGTTVFPGMEQKNKEKTYKVESYNKTKLKNKRVPVAGFKFGYLWNCNTKHNQTHVTISNIIEVKLI